MSPHKSYGQILKSTSIMGGAAAITLLLGLVRTKSAAVLIGTSGVGLLAGFTVIQGVISTVAGFGIQSSAVREVAVAIGKGDEQAVGRTVLTLRRFCWLSGLMGIVAMILFSPLLGKLTFSSDTYTIDIAALGIAIFFGNLAGGQLALLQGMRRIGDMARANAFGAALSTLSAIGFYFWLQLRGIVPALISAAIIQLILSWYYARQIPVPTVQLGWRQTFSEASKMVELGLVFMWNSLLLSAVGFFTVTFINQQINLQAVGIYSAAYALSGMFVNFVISAMGADYYPRLAALADDKMALRRLVNEQTEIGALLAVPGLMATLVLAPFVVLMFYTSDFAPAAGLLHWFILGCLGRVISFPLGFVMLVLGKWRLYLLTETSFNIIHVTLINLGLQFYGLEGVAIAFFVMYAGYIIAVYLICRHLIGFAWSAEFKKIAVFTLPSFGATFVACRNLSLWPASFIGLALTLVVSVFCLRALAIRVGPEHRIVRVIARLPGAKSLLPVS